jgi:pyruvate dehydrogenase E1 component beta subunit
VRKTGKALIVHEAPIRRLTGLDTPIPYNRNLERAAVPQVDGIAREARKLARGEY